jgi:uncharacterized protein (DUF1697 family)
MPRLVAFLRAINVGGHVVTMDTLRRHFVALGLQDVETFIASGNVIFSSRVTRTGPLERKIERRLLDGLGYEVKTFIRTGDEVGAVAAWRPFTDALRKAATTLSVGFLAEPLGSAAIRALAALRTDIDHFHVNGRELWWLCLKGQGESTVSNVVFEKALKVSVTFRNITTIARLRDKYDF